MATQNVIDKILENATAEAQKILDRYTKNAEEIKQKTNARIAALRKQCEHEATLLKETEITRAISQKRLEYNKSLTQKKRAQTARVIDEALSTLPQHKDYPDFLIALIKASSQTGGELSINETDWQKYKSLLETFFKKEKMDFEIKTDDKIQGGITITKGKMVFHGSLKLIGELLQDELTIAVSETLF